MVIDPIIKRKAVRVRRGEEDVAAMSGG